MKGGGKEAVEFRSMSKVGGEKLAVTGLIRSGGWFEDGDIVGEGSFWLCE